MLTKPLIWLSSHSRATQFVPILYAPVGVMLLTEITPASALTMTTAALLVTLALLLLCAELAWMAYVDLTNVADVAAQSDLYSSFQLHASEEATRTEDYVHLNRFFWTAISTIALELIGFYIALFSLRWGAFVVILSQIWFNLLAGVQLFPKQSPSIVLFGISQRVEVLLANGAAVLLLCLWTLPAMKLPAAAGLLTLTVLFLILKYGPPAYENLKNRP